MISIMLILVCSLSVFSVSKASNDTFYIYPEVQQAMEESSLVDPANELYFEEVKQMFYENVHTNSEDLNSMLAEAVSHINSVDFALENKLSTLTQEQEEMIENRNMYRDNETNYQSALSNYALGVSLFRVKGCPYAADSMEHAVVPENKVGTSYTPTTLVYNQDSWAKKLCLIDELFWEIEGKFQSEILATGKTSGSISGGFSFTEANSSLDAYLQLHNVDYVVTFTKKSNGYASVTRLKDLYNFEKNKYSGIMGAAVDYAYYMQQRGYIKPYYISIVYSY